jgi:hypothetical protein
LLLLLILLLLLLLLLLMGLQLLLVFVLPLRLVLCVLCVQCGHLIAMLQSERVRLLLRGERLALPTGALLSSGAYTLEYANKETKSSVRL